MSSDVHSTGLSPDVPFRDRLSGEVGPRVGGGSGPGGVRVGVPGPLRGRGRDLGGRGRRGRRGRPRSPSFSGGGGVGREVPSLSSDPPQPHPPTRVPLRPTQRCVSRKISDTSHPLSHVTPPGPLRSWGHKNTLFTRGSRFLPDSSTEPLVRRVDPTETDQ